MTAEEYLEKYKDGYPSDGNGLQPRSKKELKEKFGRVSFWSSNGVGFAGRYNSGLKVVEDNLGDEDPTEVVCHLKTRNGNLVIEFQMPDNSWLSFGFFKQQIQRIAVISNFEILSEKENSGFAGALIGDLLMGSFGRKVGRELGKVSVTKVSSKERINVLAFHTMVKGKKNVITVLFKYTNLQPINRFLYRNFEKKVIQISGSDGEADQ